MEKVPSPGILVMGLLWRRQEDLERALEMVSDLFGPVRRRSGAVSFDQYTTYYAREMGVDLNRCLASWGALPRGALAECKLATNRVERTLARDGRRRVNLDPGLLTPESLVLATTKPYAQRIYLGKGIYGDLTLVFKKGGYEPMPWTYPDYREGWARLFLNEVRRELLSAGEGEP